MKIAHFGLILAVGIIFSYQNCIRPKNSEVTTVNQALNIKLADENIQKIIFSNTENQTIEKNSKIYTLVGPVLYDINYQTGEILRNANINDSQTYCLSEALHSEMQDIVGISSICKNEQNINDNRVCSQIYKPGYAVIVTNRETFDIGSSSDSCGTVTIDFCEVTSREMLKGWFQAVKNQLPELICPATL